MNGLGLVVAARVCSPFGSGRQRKTLFSPMAHSTNVDAGPEDRAAGAMPAISETRLCATKVPILRPLFCISMRVLTI